MLQLFQLLGIALFIVWICGMVLVTLHIVGSYIAHITARKPKQESKEPLQTKKTVLTKEEFRHLYNKYGSDTTRWKL